MKNFLFLMVCCFVLTNSKLYSQSFSIDESQINSIYLKDTTAIIKKNNFVIEWNPNEKKTATVIITGSNLTISDSVININSIFFEDKNIKVVDASGNNDTVYIELKINNNIIPGKKKGSLQPVSKKSLEFYFVLHSTIVPELNKTNFKKIKLFTGESLDITEVFPTRGINNIESFYFQNLYDTPNTDINIFIKDNNHLEIYPQNIPSPSTKLYCRTKNIDYDDILLGNVSTLFVVSEKNVSFEERKFYKSKRKIEIIFDNTPDYLIEGEKYYLKIDEYSEPLELIFKDTILFSSDIFNFNIPGERLWRLYDKDDNFLNITGWINILDYPVIEDFKFLNTDDKIRELYGEYLFSSKQPMTYKFMLTLYKQYSSDILCDIEFFGKKLPESTINNIIRTGQENSTLFEFNFTMPNDISSGINYIVFDPEPGNILKEKLHSEKIYKFEKPMGLNGNNFIEFEYIPNDDSSNKRLNLNEENKRYPIDIDIDSLSDAKFIFAQSNHTQHLKISLMILDFNGKQIYPENESEYEEKPITIEESDKIISLISIFKANYQNFLKPNHVIKVIIYHDVLKYNPRLKTYPEKLTIFLKIVRKKNQKIFTNREMDINIVPFQSCVVIFDKSDTTGNKLRASPFNIGFNMIWEFRNDFGFLDRKDDFKLGFGAYITDIAKLFNNDDQKISFMIPLFLNWNLVDKNSGKEKFKIFLGGGAIFEFNFNGKNRTLPSFILGFSIPFKK